MQTDWTRFERYEDDEVTAWQIRLDEAQLHTTEGTKTLESNLAAVRGWGAEIAGKMKEGFVLAPGRGRAHRNEAMESKIMASRDDADYLVYADWLQAQGDPRGEFVALRHSLASERDSEKRKELAKAQLQLVRELGPYLVPPRLSTAVDETASVRWHDWFVRKFDVRLRNGYVHAVRMSSSAIELSLIAHELFLHPAGRFLERLEIAFGQGPEQESDRDLRYPVDAFACCPPLNLRYLEMGRVSLHLEADLQGLWKHVPNLEELCLYAYDAKLGTIEHAKLQHFTYMTPLFKEPAFRSIIDAQWPQLESLYLWFGADRDAPDELGGSYGNDSATDRLPLIQPILDGESLPNLRALGLMNCCYTDQFVHALAQSKVLRQLTHLNFWGGTMAADGVKTIVDHVDRFAHLEHLDVGQNFLDADAVAKLSALPFDVNVRDQKEPGDWGEDDTPMRYPTLAE